MMKSIQKRFWTEGGHKMAVSIRDVAKSAGVSVSTVSRALNGYSDVNEDTRKKIQKTVEELGYMPNQSAKNLSSKSKKKYRFDHLRY